MPIQLLHTLTSLSALLDARIGSIRKAIESFENGDNESLITTETVSSHEAFSDSVNQFLVNRVLQTFF